MNNESFTRIKGPDKRNYNLCENCKLIFVDKENLLSKKKEKERYLEHNNSISEPGYVDFLNQAIEPALKYLDTGMKGLDYGCGYSRTLSLLLKRNKIQCLNYDPYFFPDLPVGPFDFIFATESFEHFYSPRNEMIKIKSLLKPSGYLIMMTSLWEDKVKFSQWGYANDYTHVSFYHKKTMKYLSEKFNFEIKEIKNPRVIILRENSW